MLHVAILRLSGIILHFLSRYLVQKFKKQAQESFLRLRSNSLLLIFVQRLSRAGLRLMLFAGNSNNQFFEFTAKSLADKVQMLQTNPFGQFMI